jgi:NADPH-dependent 2,4-dienoyl-CoA reductase/sulfur reductase-like enzyme
VALGPYSTSGAPWQVGSVMYPFRDHSGEWRNLADAQDSGSCVRKDVGVQVPPRPRFGFSPAGRAVAPQTVPAERNGDGSRHHARSSNSRLVAVTTASPSKIVRGCRRAGAIVVGGEEIRSPGDIIYAVGVTSTPFKCPPAPSETALLLHDYLVARGLRDRSQISLVMPLPVPIPPSPAPSAALLEAFAERDVGWHPNQLVRELDPSANVARFADGNEMPYDLFLGVPAHRVPAVVAESGMTVNGWIPVNPLTLETSYPGVFAVGDVTSVGTPKAGVFSERQAAVAAERIASLIRGGPATSEYDGRGMCYLEFGHEEVARVEVTFVSGQPPIGNYEAASEALAVEKAGFGASRIQRWFDRAWANLPEQT